MLALNAMGYGAIWRTGKLAFNPFVAKALGLNKSQEILGFLYLFFLIFFIKNNKSLNINQLIECFSK